MAKSSRHRAMPSTPSDRSAPSSAGAAAANPPAPVTPGPPPSPPAPPSTADNPAPRPAPKEAPKERAHVLSGTGCTAGHVPGQELDAGKLGTVPSQRRTRIGFGLVVWCVGGVGVLALVGITSATWAQLSVEVALLWLAFAAFVVRRAGHRGRCWRTRTWRHAWGGLAPGS